MALLNVYEHHNQHGVWEQTPSSQERCSNETLYSPSAAFKAITSMLIGPWAGPGSCVHILQQEEGMFHSKDRFSEGEKPLGCVQECKAPLPMPEAFESFVMDEKKMKKDKSRIDTFQISGYLHRTP